MRKAQDNYAFIDGTNLNKSLKDEGWDLHEKRFRRYLEEHYSVMKAYYFIGRLGGYEELYDNLTNKGYELIFKEAFRTPSGNIKGNVDAEIVLQAMIDYDDYDKAVIVTSDGDISCLIKYLAENSKLLCVLAPSRDSCSVLIKKAAKGYLSYIGELRGKLEYTRKNRRGTV